MRVYWTFLIAVFSFGLSAQGPGVISQGRILAFGGICFDSSNDKEEFADFNTESTWSTFSLTAAGGYAIGDNQVVGLGIGYDIDKSTQLREPDPDNTSAFYVDNTDIGSRFYVAPFYRAYKFCGSDFAVVGTAKAPIGFENSSSESLVNSFDPDEGTAKVEDPSHVSFGVWLTPSILWMPDENWSLEASVGQIGFSSSSASDGDDKITSFDFAAKLYLFYPNLAFAYYF